MSQNITWLGSSYVGVENIGLPKTGGGTAKFVDTSPTTATDSDVISGKIYFKADGSQSTGTGSGGSSITVESLTITAGGTYTAPTGKAYSPVTVASGSATPSSAIASSGGATISTETGKIVLSKTVANTPQVTAGYVASGIQGNTDITLRADCSINSSSSLTASTLTVTAPAGYYASNATKTLSDENLTEGNIKSGVSIFGVTGNYTGGGGASNIVQGTFTTSATRNTTGTVTLNYTGSGYPIACLVYVDGGAYNNGTGGNTTWYNSVNRYDCGYYSMVKSRTTTTPTYSTSGADNYGTVAIIYKNSTSTATTYTRTSSMTANTYTSSSTNPNNSTGMVRFKGNGKTLAYYIGNAGSSNIGFPPSTQMAYIVIYSS